MRCRLIERITQLEPGRLLEAVRPLTTADRYLEDHFPRFPVMPGVLMLETMYQASYWLVHKTAEFAYSVATLKEARNVKFTGFVKPGQTLVVTAEIKKQDGNLTTLMTRAAVEDKTVASARLLVETFQLADRYPHRASTQDYLVRKLRRQFEHVVSGAPDDPPTKGLSMRWLWLDHFVEFVRGQRAVAIKNLSMTEEPMSDYLPGFPIFPCSLIVEGLAWTGGILANELRGFQERVVLAKVNKAVFHRPALAGDQLRYSAAFEANEAEGALIRGTSHIGDELQAEVEMFLANLPDSFEEVKGDLADPAETLAMMRAFGLYDVGRTPDGEPLAPPPKLLNAEQAAQTVAR